MDDLFEQLKRYGEIMDGYYFITNWPSDIKPFYVMPHPEEPEKSYVDLMYVIWRFIWGN